MTTTIDPTEGDHLGDAPPAATPAMTRTAAPANRRDRLAASPAAVLGVLVALVGAAVGSGVLDDNSFLTHLATGRLILDGGFPHTDPYTFTAAGEPWVVQSWLASVTYAGLERTFGAGAIVVLHGVLGGLVAGVAWMLSRPAGALVGRVLLMIPVLAIGSGFWLERPYMIGLAALAAALLAAEGRLHPAWLVPVGWIWANSHGGWPLGIVALVLLAVGRRLDGDASRVERRALGALVGGLLLGAVNPYGVRILTFPFELLGRRQQLFEIIEWQAPDFQSPPQLALLGLLALAILVVVRRPSWRAALPLVAFMLLALTGVRNLPVAALVLVPGTAAGLAGLGSAAGTSRRRAGAMAIAVVGALGVVVLAVAGGRPPFRFDTYPVAQLEFLAERGKVPTEDRFLVPDYVGNYLSLRHGTDAAIYVDDRVEVAPPALTTEYLGLLRGRPGWDDTLDARAFDAVVWPADSPLAEYLRLDPDWDVVDDDDEWLVAVPAE